MRPSNYEKFVYWIPPREYRSVERALKEFAGKALFTPASYPCEVLSPARPLGVVLPETWNQACNRQGSWYRTSERKVQILVVSSRPVPALGPYLWGRITVVPFAPPRLPLASEVQALLKDPCYTGRMPPEWPHLSDEEKAKFTRYFESKGLRVPLDTVLAHQSANHANFLQPAPRFCVNEGGEKVPYSIMPEEYTCCACHEIFGVLGADHPRKYVMRCPGLKFVDLGKSEYFLVESGQD